MSKTYTAAAAWGLSVTGSVEGADVHIVRSFRGNVQHKFLRADIHAATDDGLAICVLADLDYLKQVLAGKAVR